MWYSDFVRVIFCLRKVIYFPLGKMLWWHLRCDYKTKTAVPKKGRLYRGSTQIQLCMHTALCDRYRGLPTSDTLLFKRFPQGSSRVHFTADTFATFSLCRNLCKVPLFGYFSRSTPLFYNIIYTFFRKCNKN